jgi:hypothetical protein
MGLRIQGLAVLLLAGALLGCDGEDPPPPEEPIDELARFLPDDVILLHFADLAAAREQLGLPADADTLAFEVLADDDYDPKSPEARLLDAAMTAMPDLGYIPPKGRTETVRAGADVDRLAEFSFQFKPDPVTEAFDSRAIAAAAIGASPSERGSLTAMRTSQPFEQLAAALTKEGYERNGPVLSKPGAPIIEVANAGDGVVVFASKKASAAEAIDDPGGGLPELLALVEPADEPIVHATVGVADSCVTEFGGWQDARGSSGAFRIATDGAAELDRVDLEGFRKLTRTDLGEPSAEGDTVEVPFSGGEAGGNPLLDLSISFGQGLYDCG